MQTADKNYISILVDGLKKKAKILDEIKKVCDVQTEIIKQQDIDLEEFDETITQKEKYIEELQIVDRGFQSVYERVKDKLAENKSLYKDEIQTMQMFIKEITEKSMDVQAIEARNKDAFQQKVVYARKEKRAAKAANKVASNYYQNMNKLGAVEAQFLDTKK